MNPPDAMLDAIYLGDDPDTAALIVADWYDEHDQAVRARLIRLCVRLTQMAVDDPMRYEVADERDRLLAMNMDAILGVVPLTESRWTFEGIRNKLDSRGQPAWLDLPDKEFLVRYSDAEMVELLTAYPNRRLRLHGVPKSIVSLVETLRVWARGIDLTRSAVYRERFPDWFQTQSKQLALESLALAIPDVKQLSQPEILRSPAVAGLRSLRIVSLPTVDIHLTGWRKSVWAARLHTLTLEGELSVAQPRMDPQTLFNGKLFPALREFNLANIELSHTIAGWDQAIEPLRSLRILRLVKIKTTPSGFAALGRYLSRSGLVDLQIERLDCGGSQGVRDFFADWGDESTIRQLRILNDTFEITTEMLEAISAWSGFSRLRRLELLRFRPNAESLNTLIDAIGASAIEELILGSHVSTEDFWTAEGFRRLSRLLRPGQIRELEMDCLRTSSLVELPANLVVAWANLLQSPGLRGLRALHVGGLAMSANNLRLLGEHPLPELQVLGLATDKLVDSAESAIAALLDSPNLPRLWRLEAPFLNLSPIPGWRLLRPGILICPERMT